MTAPTFALSDSTYVDPTEIAAVTADAGKIRVLLRTSGVWLDAPAYDPATTTDSMSAAVARLRGELATAVASAELQTKAVTSR